jgi:predicted flap endonuclease-1-like 5' DNA nuclease
MGQGPSRGGHEPLSDYQSRQRGVDMTEANQTVQTDIDQAAEWIAETDREDHSAIEQAVSDTDSEQRLDQRLTVSRTRDHTNQRDLSTLTDLDGIGPQRATALQTAGYDTIGALQAASTDELTTVTGINERLAQRISTQTAEQWPQTTRTVDEETWQAIIEIPFDTDPDDIDALIARWMYQATANEFASRTLNSTIAHTMFTHVGELVNERDQPTALRPAAGTPAATATINVTAQADRQILMHEFGHLLADAYGYADGEHAQAAIAAYHERQRTDPTNDPVITSPSHHPECLLSQDNGDRIEDVPSEIDQLITSINEGWSHLQTRIEAGDDPSQWTVIDNYCTTTAREFLAQVNEYMQQPDEVIDRQFLENYPDVVRAYTAIYVPSESVIRALTLGDRTDNRTG